MKQTYVILTVLSFAASGCQKVSEPLNGLMGPVYLTVDKVTYMPEDTVRVTLHNESSEPIFLEGCSPVYIATKTDTRWIEAPTRVCVWEGIARKVNPGSVYQEQHVARYFRGVHRFVAPIYLECLEGKPISEAQCKRQERVYSPEFTVVGYEDAAGNLGIVTQKSEYSWSPNDLGSSRQILADLFTNVRQTYYAKLGDAFNSNLDQDDLFVAEGSDAFIEKLNPDGSWRAMPRAILIEGTRLVALRPGKRYRLFAWLHPWRGDETGYFRIKVEYFDRIDPVPGTPPRVDYSNLFTIR